MKERFPNGLDRESGAKSRGTGDGAVQPDEKTENGTRGREDEVEDEDEAESPLPFTGTINTIAGKITVTPSTARDFRT